MNASQNTCSTIASIVTWNHAHCIEACINSLLRQTHKPLKIVAYDNASHDGTRDVLKKFSDRIHIILAEENSGFCGGHNAVISATSEDFILLVNPDVVLREDYVEGAMSKMMAQPTIGTVCGLLLQSDPAMENCLIDGTGLITSRSRRFFLRHHCQRLSNVALCSGEVFGCDGALPLLRRKMVEHISINGNFFDPMFFAHKEDHDVAWRAQLYGWKTAFEPTCVAVHPRVFRPGDLGLRRKLAPEIKYHAVKNDLIMLLKNEDSLNFIKDSPWILPRRLGIFFYALLFERTSVKAYGFVLKNLSAILAQRKIIKQNRKLSASAIRTRFFA